MQVNDNVKILPPFDTAYPGVYPIVALSVAPNTFKVDVFNDGEGADFIGDYLELA